MILEELCRKRSIEIHFMEHGLLPGSINIERNGQMALSDICQNSNSFNRQKITLKHKRQAQSYIKSVVKRKLNRKPIGLSLTTFLRQGTLDLAGGPVVFYAGQNDPKSGILPPTSDNPHSPFYQSTFDVLPDLAEYCSNVGATLLYKPHPSVADYELGNEFDFSEYPNVVKVPENVDFIECVEASDVFVTILSTGAYQALFRHIPVVQLGNSPLSVSQAVYQLEARDELPDLMTLALENGFTGSQKRALDEHVARLREHYVWRQESEPVSELDFPQSFNDFVTSTFEQEVPLNSEDDTVIFEFEGGSTILPLQSDALEPFVNKYKGLIKGVETNAIERSDLLLKYLPNIKVETAQLSKEKYKLFLTSSDKHAFLGSALVEVDDTTSLVDIKSPALATNIKDHIAGIENEIVAIVPVDLCISMELAQLLVDLFEEYNITIAGYRFGFGYVTVKNDGWNDTRQGVDILLDKRFTTLSSGHLIGDQSDNISYIGSWLNTTNVNFSKKYKNILIIKDFSQIEGAEQHSSSYQKKWLDYVTQSLEKSNVKFEILEPSKIDPNYTQLATKIERSAGVISPVSDYYFVAKSFGKIALVFDYSKNCLIEFSREYSLDQSEGLIDYHLKKKRVEHTNIVKGGSICKPHNLESYANVLSKYLNNFLPYQSMQVVAFGRDAIANLNAQIRVPLSLVNNNKLAFPESNGRVLIFSIMPDRGYSGGRYHALVLAEGIAANGYQVELVTNNKPFFYDDFDMYPYHGNVNINLVKNFSLFDYSAMDNIRSVVVVPDLSGDPTMYIKAINAARDNNIHISMVNFESPNWFNSMVSGHRDESLWDNWRATSKFCSNVLSTTKESVKFAKDYYLDIPNTGKHRHLYAAINSYEADQVAKIEKEKRVIFFLPRARLSDHKGWRSITKMFDEAFAGHTLVLLCAQSSLDKKLHRELLQLAEKYDFDIEFKVRLNDRQKFQEISRACLMVFPSEFEGYGYPPVEAISVGTPCVAFDIPVLRETCGNSLDYVDVGDWDALKAKVGKSLRDKKRLSNTDIARGVDIASFGTFCEKISNMFGELEATQTIWTDNYKSESEFTFAITEAFYGGIKWYDSDIKVKVFNQLLDFDGAGNEFGRYGTQRCLVVLSEGAFQTEIPYDSSAASLMQLLSLESLPLDIVVDSPGLAGLLQHKKSDSWRILPFSKDKSQINLGLTSILTKLACQYKYTSAILIGDEYKYETISMVASQLDKLITVAPVKNSVKVWERASNTEETIEIPSSLPLAQGRRDWMTSSQKTNEVAVFVDEFNQDSVAQLIAYCNANLNLRFMLFGKNSERYFMSAKCKNLTVIGVLNFDKNFAALRRCRAFCDLSIVNSREANFFVVLAKLLGVLDLSRYVDAELCCEEFMMSSHQFQRDRRIGFNEIIDQFSKDESYKLFAHILRDFCNPSNEKVTYSSDIKFIFSQSMQELMIDFSLQGHSSEYTWNAYKIALEELRIDDAIRLLRRLRNLHPTSVVVSAFFIRLSVMIGGFEAAIKEINRLISRYPMEGELYKMKAYLMTHSKSYDTVIECFAQACCFVIDDPEFFSDAEFVFSSGNSKYQQMLKRAISRGKIIAN